jgi:hypothetical protein
LAAWLTVLWDTFCAAARRCHPGATHYAEKVPAWLPAALRGILPARTLYLVRDPRDLYLSAKAFFPPHQTAGDTDRDRGRRFVPDLLLYHENYRADRGREDCALVRYEDLIRDPAAAADQLGVSLGLTLSPAALGGETIPANHRTTPSATASIGRWRREGLPPVVRATVEEHLHELLADADYDRDGAAPPAPEVRFADLLGRKPPPVCSADGTLHPGPDGTAAVSIRGPDFWIELPPAAVEAAVIREVWVCVLGATGDHTTLYWRGPREGFDEARAMHLPFHPGGHWQLIRFPVGGHPAWRGRVAQLRFDPFNGPVGADPSGALRWLRLVE